MEKYFVVVMRKKAKLRGPMGMLSVGVADSLPVKSFLSDKVVCIRVFYSVYLFPFSFSLNFLILFNSPFLFLCPKNK